MASDQQHTTDKTPDPRKEMKASPDGTWTQDLLQALSDEVSAVYPPPRQGTELVLLEVDPCRAHAYWNIDLEDYRQAQARGEGWPLVLRVSEVREGAAPSSCFDIEVQGLQGNWFVNFWQEGGHYEAELGLRGPGGDLVRLARSERIRLPGGTHPVVSSPAAPSPRETVSDLLELASDAEPMGLPATADPVDHATPEEGGNEFPWSPCEPAPAAGAGLADALTSNEPLVTAARPVTDRLPSLPEPETPVGPWPDAAELMAQLPAAEDACVAAWYEKTTPPGSAISAAHDQTRHELESPEPPVSTAPAGGEAPSSHVLPLDSYISYSSLENGRRQVALEVNVELHIHGRARPGTEVTLYGQKIPLRPDGTFSVRRPLPHGAVVLPLLATEPETPPTR